MLDHMGSSFTCRNNVEDTRLVGFLISHHVGAPAQQRAKVHMRVRSVRNQGMTAGAGVARPRQQAGGERVIEGPGEGVCRRIALD